MSPILHSEQAALDYVAEHALREQSEPPGAPEGVCSPQAYLPVAPTAASLADEVATLRAENAELKEQLGELQEERDALRAALRR